MQIHNKRFIFIRIMVKVNVVADQNLIINLELSVPSVQCYQVFQVDQMSCRYDDDGSAVRHEEEDSTSTKSTDGTSGRFAGQAGDQKAGNFLMEF